MTHAPLMQLNEKCAALWKDLITLQTDYHDFNPSTVPNLPYPSAVQFSKLVSKGQPTMFDIYDSHDAPRSSLRWKACSWTDADLKHKIKEAVEVALTPHGNADALLDLNPNDKSANAGVSRIFVQPAVANTSMAELLPKFTTESSPDTPVCYLQSQNSNLDTDALAPLMEDLPENYDFAREVLGEPDARNIWIGDHRSVTSIHRDPYENLYLVLRGSKTFRLWAPVDEVSMPSRMVKTGHYRLSADKDSHSNFEVVVDEEADMIPWVDLDPLAPDFFDPGMMRVVTVKAGQMLYLPSGWYHHVTQTCGKWDDGTSAPCIAVNYWYDMEYEGEKYAFRQLLGRLVEQVKHG